MDPSLAVREFLARALDCDARSLDAGAAFGVHPKWDSLGHVRLLALIEEELGIELDAYSAERYSTIESLSEIVG